MKFILIFFLIFSCGISFGDDNLEEYDDIWLEENMPSLERKKRKSLFKKNYRRLSKTLGDVSDSIDDFFADPRTKQESNGTRLRFGFSVQMTNKEPTLYDSGFNFKLDLPRTKRRWKIIFVSISEDLREDEEVTEEKENVEEGVKKRSLFAGLRYFAVKNKHFHVATDGGIKLVWPPDPFARVRLRESLFFGKWEARFTQQGFWYESRGFGATGGIDFDRPLTRKLMFRQSNSGVWIKNDRKTDYNHSLNILQSLSNVDGLAYSTGINSVAAPHPILQNYFVTVRYRRAIYHNAIFGDIQPIASWPRDRNFAFRPGILLGIEFLWGPKYMKPKPTEI